MQTHGKSHNVFLRNLVIISLAEFTLVMSGIVIYCASH
jgi:hypothetical protein